jgi:hypothetical protein
MLHFYSYHVKIISTCAFKILYVFFIGMVIRLVSIASGFNSDISVDKRERSTKKSPFNSEIGYGTLALISPLVFR